MKRLTKAQIIKMHRLLIQETGGSEGIRDEGLLDSALNAPFQTFDGEDVYKTIPAKAAKLGFLLRPATSYVPMAGPSYVPMAGVFHMIRFCP